MFIGFHGSRLVKNSNDAIKWQNRAIFQTDAERIAAGRKMKRRAVFEPYDMDTAIGTNNEGDLTFEYFWEDTDHFVENAGG
jgi:hypothetical protein